VAFPLFAIVELEQMTQEFVLESKKIEIPGFPHAFNPSIIRWQGKLLLSFRILSHPEKSKFDCHVGLVWLDEEFNPVSTPQLIDTSSSSLIPSRIDDARLVSIGNVLWLVYADNKDEKITRGGFRVYIAPLEVNENSFSIGLQECLFQFEGESSDKREKNWSPFDYKGEMRLSYNLSPHHIFKPILGTGSCESVAISSTIHNWQWGELRGGTPGLKIDEHRYLSFFHSSINLTSIESNEQTMLHYFMGAYTFSSEPPFEIKEISPRPIIGPGFYHGNIYKPYWKPVCVVFPCGFIFDNEFIWVVYGKHDHECWISKMNKEGLINSLISL
jgi:predicted GH43/DUF377 family glycosyl hydrolase